MIRLFDWNRTANNINEALTDASKNTGFDKADFKCEIVKEPQKIGLFKKEPGIFHCWYEYEGLNCNKEFTIAEANLYFDITKKKILIVRFGFKAYEIDYLDLVDYELVVSTTERTFTVSSKNKTLKGAILFGATGAIVGASKSNIMTDTVDMAEVIIRLKFANKEPFEVLTCNWKRETDDEEWRDISDQSKEIDKWLKTLIGD